MAGFALTALLVIVLPLSALGAGKALVEFNPQKGTVTVEAAGVAIEEVLSGIAQKTGIRVFIDPDVQKNVTVNLKAVPLETALHQIARGLSYALFFESGRGRHRLTGIRIVTQGKPGPEPPGGVVQSPPVIIGGGAGGEGIEPTDDLGRVRRHERFSRRIPSVNSSDASPDDTGVRPTDTDAGISDRGTGSDLERYIPNGPKRHRQVSRPRAGFNNANGIAGEGPDNGQPDDVDVTGDNPDTAGSHVSSISASPGANDAATGDDTSDPASP